MTFRPDRMGVAILAIVQFFGHASAQEAVKGEKIEVTGSNIKRVDSETGLPVQMITRAEIDRMGVTTTEQLLQRVSAIGPGGHSTAQGLGDGARSGLSAVSLRGLGSSNTLVLLNGRRLSNFAFNDIGGSAVNVNQIPLAAVERVEVLKDGASAIYGTDAIGGVINFILRKDFEGVEASAYLSGTQDGGGATHQYSLSAGYGSVAKDGFNVLAVVDYENDKALSARLRSFAATSIRPDLGVSRASFNTFPANFRYFVNPRRTSGRYNATAQDGCAPASGSFQVDFATGAPVPLQPYCVYDFTSVIDITPPAERIGLYARGVWQFAPDHQAFAEYRLGRTDIVFAVSETPVGDFTGRGLIRYPAGGRYYPSSVTLPDGSVVHPEGDLLISWRLQPEGRRTDRVKTDENGWAAGLQGLLWGWDYEAVLSGGSSNATDTFLSGNVSESLMGQALRTGLIDVFSNGPQTPAAQALLDATVIHGKVRESDARVTSAAARGSREIFETRYGPASLALGLDDRREEIEERPEPVLFSGDIQGAGTPILPTTHASRTTISLFGELDIPLLKGLEAQVAVRYDHFSDFGGTTNPKVALRWTPTRELLLRASYGTGFRAPTLTDLFLPGVLGNDEGRYDPVRCANTPDGPVPIGDFVNPDECAFLFQRTGGNPKAKPERSHQWSAGVVFEPKPGTSFGVDYWTIRRRNSLQLLQEQVVFDSLAVADPVTAQGRFVRRPRLADGRCDGDADVPTPAGAPCAIEYFNTVIENLGKYNVSGIDVSAAGRWPTQAGVFSARLDGTYFVQYRYQLLVDGPYYDNAGRVADNGAVSRWKHYAALDWKRGAWGATLAQNFVRGYADEAGLDAAGNELAARRVGSYETYDAQGSWDGMKNLKATLGVHNIFNRDPPTSRQSSTFQVGYDARYYDPSGRTYYVSLKYGFR
jgi:iron complex outermembrane receptor protein